MVYIILIAGLFSGCKAVPESRGPSGDRLVLIEEARKSLAVGEFYEARKMVRQILDSEPDDAQAKKLMAEIIDLEIERQKEIFDTKAREELSPQQKGDAVKTWLERSRELFDLGQYDEALLAAEKIFLYDPENLEASRFIDKIQKEAYRAGKGEGLIMKQMMEGEIQERVAQYQKQAKAWMDAGRWGAARLAVEKILLLEPENREALDLYEKIKERRNLHSR
jgi:tetratricopeptide (TPR) repeat protein